MQELGNNSKEPRRFSTPNTTFPTVGETEKVLFHRHKNKHVAVG